MKNAEVYMFCKQKEANVFHYGPHPFGKDLNFFFTENYG
ncbi:hypothetical protein FORMB_16970 [Formosa sp. Hel1_33_131]|nr:hypothetical protein FORMB_16970 [Formosa sp. Hel1_33_131]